MGNCLSMDTVCKDEAKKKILTPKCVAHAHEKKAKRNARKARSMRY